MGTLLLEHLAAAARERGVDRFLAEVLAENHGMLRVFADSGFARRSTMSGPLTDLVIDTALTDLALSQISDRERRGEEFSLAALLSPSLDRRDRTRRRRTGGRRAAQPCWPPASPARCSSSTLVQRRRTASSPYRRIADVPAPVDLAVITGRRRGGRGGRRPSAAGPAFASWSSPARAAATTRSASARVESSWRWPAGTAPASSGLVASRVVNTAPEVSLHAAAVGRAPRIGGLSVASQSGALGVAILEQADRTGVGIAEFVSLGDKADVSGNDLLLHWWHQPRTRVIGLYLESFGNPRKFARLARSISRDKPILVVKSGSPDEILRAVLAQSGVLRLDTLPELIDVARVLADQPVPRGPRLAIVTNAHGVWAFSADAAGAAGLVLPALSGAHAGRRPRDRADGRPREPARPRAPTATQPRSVRSSPCCWPRRRSTPSSSPWRSITLPRRTTTLARVCEAAATNPTFRSSLTCVGAGAVPGLVAEHGVRLPVFDFPELAVRALGHGLTYGNWLRHEPGTVPILPAPMCPVPANAPARCSRHPCGGPVRGAAPPSSSRCSASLCSSPT